MEMTQTRRRFLTTAALAGTAGLVRTPRALAAEEVLETTSVRLLKGPGICPLARAEAQIAIPLLFERFPCLLVDPQHGIEHKSAPVFNGVRALWVRTA